MTSWVVADSGTLLATVLVEKFSTQAKQLWRSWDNQQIQVAAPTLFIYEVVAVMRKSETRGILSAQDALRGRDYLLRQPIELMIDEALLRRGYALAAHFNRPTAYDSQYLAVAEKLGCDFWTADERLYNTVKSELHWVQWLGNFTIS